MVLSSSAGWKGKAAYKNAGRRTRRAESEVDFPGVVLRPGAGFGRDHPPTRFEAITVWPGSISNDSPTSGEGYGRVRLR